MGHRPCNHGLGPWCSRWWIGHRRLPGGPWIRLRRRMVMYPPWYHRDGGGRTRDRWWHIVRGDRRYRQRRGQFASRQCRQAAREVSVRHPTQGPQPRTQDGNHSEDGSAPCPGLRLAVAVLRGGKDEHAGIRPSAKRCDHDRRPGGTRQPTPESTCISPNSGCGICRETTGVYAGPIPGLAAAGGLRPGGRRCRRWSCSRSRRRRPCRCR